MRWDLEDLDRQLHQQPEPTGEPVPEPSSDKPQRPAVITAIVTSKQGVLIGKRNDGKPPWTFIAGENEPGESPADTIVREVKEETGLRITAGRIIGERVHPKTGRHMVYVAAAPVGSTLNVFVGDEDELAEVRWASLAEADVLLPGMFEPVREHLEKNLGG
jgi:NADH pyrophosphatase NudC (nudix superfamily)